MASIWYGVDPLAEKYKFLGSYVYCKDNPISFIDKFGERPEGNDSNRPKRVTFLFIKANGQTCIRLIRCICTIEVQ